MDTGTQNPNMTRRAVQIVLAVVGIVGLYYLYKFLFVSSSTSMSALISGNKTASTNPSSPIIIPASSMVPIYEGGTFTLSMWININNWNYRQGMNKYILGIGGTTFDTIRVYLGANKAKLHVRIQTKEMNAVPAGNSTTPSTDSDNLAATNLQQTFANLQTDSGLLDSLELCDLPEVDLQKWVNITISINGRTCDIYLDGKLTRSCVLPSFYKVDTGYKATLLAYGGFGGNISTVNLYSDALNPSAIYGIYSAGPAPSGIMGTIQSLL